AEGAEDTVDARRDLGTNRIHLYGTLPRDGRTEVDVAVSDPALFAGAVFRRALADAGIDVRGTVRRGRAPTEARLQWRHRSAALGDLLSFMLKTSDNLYAEQLLKTIGGGTTDAGIKAEAEALQLDGSRRVVDGSGLSRYNLV